MNELIKTLCYIVIIPLQIIMFFVKLANLNK